MIATTAGRGRLVPVKSGQVVTKGEVLVTLEAMKMETAVRADRDGTIDEVLVRTGHTVDAKDLLVTFAGA